MALAYPDRVELSEEAQHPLQRLSLRMVDRDGTRRQAPAGLNLRIRCSERPAVRDGRVFEVDVSLVSLGPDPDHLALEIAYALEPAGPVRWLIPGCFYGDNRLPECATAYPRYAEGGIDDPLCSDRWTVRMDRASHPAVFAFTDSATVALVTGPDSPLGMPGLGFTGAGDERCLRLTFPALEEPISYAGDGRIEAPERRTHAFAAGEIQTLRFELHLLPAGAHAYDRVLRAIHLELEDEHPAPLGVDLEPAARACAEGLVRWHYRPDPGVLVETAAFDRTRASIDRLEMHVAWLSGAPTACALLDYGRSREREDLAAAAVKVLDTVARGLAPCGAFYDRWTPSGWRTGWNRDPNLLHARTAAEATLFMVRALRSEEARGIEHPAWRRAVRSNLDHARRTQRADGTIGSYVDALTGRVAEWRGAAGLPWIAALSEASALFDDPADLEAAARAGDHYRRFVDEEFIYGAPEDIHLAPSSEDGYNAVLAYVALFQSTGSRGWLEPARRAADWTMSFRFSYNLDFPQGSTLRAAGFRSRGADLASPCNPHLHFYGSICLPEMMHLFAQTGDRYYLDRTREHLLGALQLLIHADGELGGLPGMITERAYNTASFGPKGEILPVSHAWSLGLTLYACQAAIRHPALLAAAATIAAASSPAA